MGLKSICIVSGSRADYGMLRWPHEVLQHHFDTEMFQIRGLPFASAHVNCYVHFKHSKPDCVLLLGDRYEILAAATAAHLQRIPIAHLCGGDVTLGSYDDAMRDAISRMASFHFVTSTAAMARLTHFGYTNVHLVGSTGIDYIRHGKWRGESPYAKPYTVVSYQSETLDAGEWDEMNLEDITEHIHGKAIWILPNADAGSVKIASKIRALASKDDEILAALDHDAFLNLLAHCELFVGNSSAMVYEAPELQIATRMIGKRQRGRVIPWGDGNASERIANILRYCS